jgi:hypothetical protein
VVASSEVVTLLLNALASASAMEGLLLPLIEPFHANLRQDSTCNAVPSPQPVLLLPTTSEGGFANPPLHILAHGPGLAMNKMVYRHMPRWMASRGHDT